MGAKLLKNLGEREGVFLFCLRVFVFGGIVILNVVKNLEYIHALCIRAPSSLRSSGWHCTLWFFFSLKNTCHSLHDCCNPLNINVSPCNVLVFCMSLMSLCWFEWHEWHEIFLVIARGPADNQWVVCVVQWVTWVSSPWFFSSLCSVWNDKAEEESEFVSLCERIGDERKTASNGCLLSAMCLRF